LIKAYIAAIRPNVTNIDIINEIGFAMVITPT